MPPAGIGKSEDELVRMLRSFLGDTPDDNRLIEDQELSDDKLRLALALALDEYNNTPPFEARKFSNFPSLAIIIHGGAIQALIMAGIVQTRNYLQFSDGGISEVIGDKAPMYQGWINQLASVLANYKSTTEAIKVSINMEQGFGYIASPYGNGFWDRQ